VRRRSEGALPRRDWPAGAGRHTRGRATELAAIAHDVGTRDPLARDIGARVEPLRDHVVGNTRRAVWVLFGAVTLVLLVAAANVASLITTRAVSRRRELAVRTAMGASRAALVRQLVTESVVLSFVGGVLGLGLAYWTLDVIVRFAASQLPRVGTSRSTAPCSALRSPCRR